MKESPIVSSMCIDFEVRGRQLLLQTIKDHCGWVMKPHSIRLSLHLEGRDFVKPAIEVAVSLTLC